MEKKDKRLQIKCRELEKEITYIFQAGDVLLHSFTPALSDLTRLVPHPGSLSPSGLQLPSSQLKEPPAPGLLPSFLQCPQLGRSLLLDPCPRDDIDVLVCRGCHGTSPHFPSRKLQCSGTLQKIAGYLLGEK